MERPDDTGRQRQRRRTRAAIVAAAERLLADGRSPSMSDIAAEADVSRRTVYLYFPTLEQLLIDATVGALSQQAVDAAIEAADPGGADAAARVRAMVEALMGQASQTLGLGRALIKLTIEQLPDGVDGRPRRGYRRIQWIEAALSPLRDQLPADRFERLVSALSMVIGWEALVVLQDLRGLSPDDQQDTTIWAAQVLIDAALREARPATT